MSCERRDALKVKTDGVRAIAEVPAVTETAPSLITGAGTILVGGVAYPAPAGLRVFSHEPLFRYTDRSTSAAKPPGGKVTSIVLHQSQTKSRGITEASLLHAKNGIHFIVEADGGVHQYGDALTMQFGHGQERNKASVGIEEVNPYSRVYPPWTAMVSSKVANRGREVETLPAARAAIALLVTWLTTTKTAFGSVVLDIPLEWPTTPLTAPVKTSPIWYDLTVGGVFAHGHRPPLAGETGKACARRLAWLVRTAL